MRALLAVSTEVVLLLTIAGSGTCGGVAHSWSQSFPGSGRQDLDNVVVDPAGDLLIAGTFAGDIDFGDGPIASAGNHDVFIAKLASDGAVLWSKTFGDSTHQNDVDIEVDSAGEIYVAINFPGTIDVGGGPVTSQGLDDILLVRFGPNGEYRWHKQYGDAEYQYVGDLAIGPNDELVLTGTFDGTIDFGGGPLTAAGSDYAWDMYVAKLDGNGDHMWSHSYGDDERIQEGMSIGIAADGMIAVSGYGLGSVDFGGGPMEMGNLPDIFMLSLTGNGEHRWSRVYGDALDEYQAPTGLGVGPDGDIILAGESNAGIDFGDGVVPIFGGFVARITRDGDPIWVWEDGSALVLFHDAHVTSGGTITLSGRASGNVAFGSELISGTSRSLLVVQLTEEGLLRWATRHGDSEQQDGRAVTLDKAGSVFIGGDFLGTMDFGGGESISASGERDVFVLALHDAPIFVDSPSPPARPLLTILPNPASLSRGVRISLADSPGAVYDVAGRRVTDLARGQARWELRTNDGQAVLPGVYFVRRGGRQVRLVVQ